MIGTGGRDLKEEIGGLMMIQGIQALIGDPETEVLVLVSKLPAPPVEKKIYDLAAASQKPVVIAFIGGEIDKVLNKRLILGTFPWKFQYGESAFCRCVAFEEVD